MAGRCFDDGAREGVLNWVQPPFLEFVGAGDTCLPPAEQMPAMCKRTHAGSSQNLIKRHEFPQGGGLLTCSAER